MHNPVGRAVVVVMLSMGAALIPALSVAQTPRGASAPGTARVTAVHLHFVPDRFSGPCPGHVKMVGEFTTNGPGTVWYHFLAGGIGQSPEGTLTFSSSGTQSVTIAATVRRTPGVPHASLIAIMEDADGHHGPLNLSSGPVPFNISCGGTTASASEEGHPAGPPAAPALSLPEGTSVEAEYLGGGKIAFKPQEQVAFLFLEGMKAIQLDFCSRTLHRLCSADEMFHGVSDSGGRPIGYRFKQDPLKDANYRYELTFSNGTYDTASNFQIEAIPLHPGIGGFLMRATKGFGVLSFHFNPSGGATVTDKKLGSYGFNGDDFLTR